MSRPRRVAFFDLETFCGTPDRPFPQPVCLSWGECSLSSRGELGELGPVSVTHWRAPARREEVRRLLSADLVVSFNGAGFDLPILWAYSDEETRGLVWRNVKRDRSWDLMISARLQDIAQTGKAPKWPSLAEVAKKRLGLHLEKEDTWRLRYGELFGVPVSRWPAEAVDYARKDVEVLWGIHEEELERGVCEPGGGPGLLVRDMGAQVRKSFGLSLLQAPGVPVSRRHVETVWAPHWKAAQAEARAKALGARIYLPERGEAVPLIREDGSRDKKAILAHARAVGLRLAGGRTVEEAVDLLDGVISKGKQKKAFVSLEDWVRALKGGASTFAELVPQGAICDEKGRPVVPPTVRALRNGAEVDRGRLVKLASDLRSAVVDEALAWWPKTPKGGELQINEETAERSKDPTLVALTSYAGLGTLLGDGVKRGRLAELRSGGQYLYRSRYDALKVTGRTGAGGAHRKGDPFALGGNFQNLPTDPGIPAPYRMRSCLVAPPGWLFIDIDFSALELHTLAEACLHVVGYSRMAEALANKIDLHALTGSRLAGVSLEEFYRLPKDVQKKWRTMAKPFNFGIAGGMGVARFIATAWTDYRVVLTPEEVKRGKRIFFSLYPEVREYMKRCADLAVVEHIHSRRLRRCEGYCDRCNSRFQGLGADAAGAAVFSVVEACYRPGGRLYREAFPVGFAHDQILALTRDDEGAGDRADCMGNIMIEAGSTYTPNVPLKVEAVLERRYAKGLDPTRDARGRLVVTEIAGLEGLHY